MPAKSKAQQQAAGAAYAAKKGEIPLNALRGVSREMYQSMSEEDLKDFSSTARKGLPKRKAKRRMAKGKRPVKAWPRYGGKTSKA